MNGKASLWHGPGIPASEGLRNPLRQSLLADLGHDFPGPGGTAGNQSDSCRVPLASLEEPIQSTDRLVLQTNESWIWLCLDLEKLPQSTLKKCNSACYKSAVQNTCAMLV